MVRLVIYAGGYEAKLRLEFEVDDDEYLANPEKVVQNRVDEWVNYFAKKQNPVTKEVLYNVWDVKTKNKMRDGVVVEKIGVPLPETVVEAVSSKKTFVVLRTRRRTYSMVKGRAVVRDNKGRFVKGKHTKMVAKIIKRLFK